MFSFQLKPIVTQTPYLSVDLNNPIHNNYKFTDGVTTDVNTTTLVHSYEFVNNVTQPSSPSAIYCPGATGFMQVANSTNTAGESDVFCPPIYLPALPANSICNSLLKTAD